MTPPKYFITGATGTQGSATIRALSALSTASNPITVHALVREPSSSKGHFVSSLASAHLTISLFKGTYDDVPAMSTATDGCAAAFINAMPALNPADPQSEIRHVTNILSALASTSTMQRVVYSSVAGCADPSVPGNFKNLSEEQWLYHYEASKFACQEAVRSATEKKGCDWTILEPAYFWTNFVMPGAAFMYPGLTERRVVTAFPAEYQLTMLDPDDIGRFAARILEADEMEMREKWSGKSIPLGSRNMSIDEVVGTINQVLGLTGKGKREEIEVLHLSLEEAKEKESQGDILTGSQIFMMENVKPVDVEKVKSYGVELGSVEEFFVRNRKASEQAVGL